MKLLLENWRKKQREYETQHEALKVPRGGGWVARDTSLSPIASWVSNNIFRDDWPDDMNHLLRKIEWSVLTWAKIRLGIIDPDLNMNINNPALYKDTSISDFTEALINEIKNERDMFQALELDQLRVEQELDTKKEEIINSVKNKIKKELTDLLADLETL